MVRLIQMSRRYQFVRAITIGLATGSIALTFQYFLWFAEVIRKSIMASISESSYWWVLPFSIVIIGIGALVSWMTNKFAPEAAGSGIPHVKLVLERKIEIRWIRVLLVKFIGGVLAIGAGFSLGREGPTVQMGSAVGMVVSKFLRSTASERSHLIACGAGAGLAGAFNAPLAGFIFVIEELRRGLSPMTYGTAFISSLTAALVTQISVGQIPSFHVTSFPVPSLEALPLFAILGVAAGLIGVVFNKSLLNSIRYADLYLKNPWVRGGVVAVVIAASVWILPEITGGGHATAEMILKGVIPRDGTIIFLLLLLVGKILLTSLSFAAGVPGGIFAPMLLIGALLGAIVGQFDHLMFPALAPTPAAFAVIGMAAVFVASVRAPLTGIVLILEMTGNYSQLFPLSIACLISYLTATLLGSLPIYDALLEIRSKTTVPSESKLETIT